MNIYIYIVYIYVYSTQHTYDTYTYVKTCIIHIYVHMCKMYDHALHHVLYTGEYIINIIENKWLPQSTSKYIRRYTIKNKHESEIIQNICHITPAKVNIAPETW